MDFSFISDDQFRSSLVADHREMSACQEAQAWKAVHVIAGSIVEALLVEYLVVSGIKPGGKDPLKLILSEAIQACLDAGVIQKSTASLCDVIRDYRNLIHPGRLIRLQQDVSPEGANIAVSLVSLITREVAEKRKALYGPTAEQIVKKLRTDHHSSAVLPQLLSESNQHEKLRLVCTLLPEAYISEEADPFSDGEIQTRLRSAYRQALDLLPEHEKHKIAEKFVKLIREDSAEKIQSYGDAFFVAEDIAHLQPQDAAITVRYLLNRIEQPTIVVTDGLIRTTAGVGNFVDIKDIPKLSDTLVRLVLRQTDTLAAKGLDFADMVYTAVDESKKRVMEGRIGHWVKFGKDKQYPKVAQERLSKLEFKWLDIPF